MDDYTGSKLDLLEPLEWIQAMRQNFNMTDMTDEELLLMRLRDKEGSLKRIRDIIKEWRHYFPFNTWHRGCLMDGYRVVLDNLYLPYPEA